MILNDSGFEFKKSYTSNDYKMTRIIIIGRVILVSQSWHEIEKSTVQMASLEKILYVRYCSDLIS